MRRSPEPSSPWQLLRTEGLVRFGLRVLRRLGVYRRFVLVGDDGTLLASGAPTGNDLPPLEQRKKNFAIVEGSKYAQAATVFRWPDVYDPTYSGEQS